jgi:hypothetical protein
MDIPAIYVEKDYWMTYALYILFNDPIGKDIIFKGGTSLSKCYQLIDRFSEDIDLVVLRSKDETDSKLKMKLKAISTLLESVMPEKSVEGITHKMGMTRKTAHTYSKEFQGDFGQVRDSIVIEATWLGYYEPFTTKSICSFIGRMMLDNNQQGMAEQEGLLPFTLQVLEPARTICEKIMSLVRFSYTKKPIDDLAKKVRHTYDLHRLLQHRELKTFLHSTAFDEMLLKVANDDVVSFKNNNEWLVYHPNDALFFSDIENVWNVIKREYNGSLKNLVYGEFPKDDAVLDTLKMIRDRMATVRWLVVL